MAQLVGNNQIKLDDGTIKPLKEGEWYDGRRYLGGTLLGVNEYEPGKFTSQEVNAQSAAAQGVPVSRFTQYLEEQAKKTNTQSQPQSQATTPSYVPGGMTGASSAGAQNVQTPQAINLPDLYKQLNQTSGISELENKFSEREKEYINAKAQINDNPFLSEGTRVGREAKIEKLFQERTANLKNDIATKKADIETQINLQTKQFDINSQAAQQSLSQFNTLLNMGALDTASGEDIANMTLRTGLSSGLIQSAIENRKMEGLQTTTQTFDDGEEEGFIIYTIDRNGNVVNQTRQVTGKSSKSQYQFSSDSGVSAFINAIKKNTSTSNGGGVATGANQNYTSEISNLWD